eukprot:TRINITY_DN8451_c0_g1_i1.p1 TRINITY_DN8451_c0_g1~~TRINITY_DN8451_c0_g1_i1.p1  ORF type:complete len:265 (+),score=116.09 TRINITY_DN8451_c0_g1_i1:47-841(+)
MDPNLEEQTMELEALEAIFMEEFTLVDGNAPASFKLRLAPDTIEENNNVVCTMHVKYTETYPETNPEIIIEAEKNLTPSQIEEIDAVVAENVEMNAYCQMIYQIAEAVKDYLLEHNEKPIEESGYTAMMRRLKTKEDEEKAKIQAEAEAAGHIVDADGNVVVVEEVKEFVPVTIESFVAWREKFEAETMPKVECKKTEKLNGRQYFEMGLHRKNGNITEQPEMAPVDEEEIEEDEEEGIEVDEELFGDEDDMDDDDLDFSSDDE